MKKGIVLHIINSTKFSGLESVACDLIQNMDDEYEGVYVTKSGPIVDVLKEKKIKYEIIEKMSTNEIRRVIRKYKPKIIHAHDYTASCICALARIKEPIISHLHNNSPWIKNIHPYSFLYLYCSRRFKKILTVSDSIKNEYIFSNIIKNKIINIGNPVSRKKVLSQVGEKDYNKKYDICCVARLTAQKNPLKFIDIINELKKENENISAIWVGEGELKEECLKKIKKLNLEKNIKLIGFKKNPYIYMASSKIFLLTSEWEGYGLVAFEASTLGLPCVVSNVGGLPNIVDECSGKICNDINDYINEIKEILNNDNIYKYKHKKAILKSIEIENQEEYILNLKKIYINII